MVGTAEDVVEGHVKRSWKVTETEGVSMALHVDGVSKDHIGNWVNGWGFMEIPQKIQNATVGVVARLQGKHVPEIRGGGMKFDTVELFSQPSAVPPMTIEELATLEIEEPIHVEFGETGVVGLQDPDHPLLLWKEALLNRFTEPNVLVSSVDLFLLVYVLRT